VNFGDSVRAKRSYGIPGDSEIRVDVANQTDAVWGDVRQGSSSHSHMRHETVDIAPDRLALLSSLLSK